MKILIVSHYFDDHGGGIELVASHLARELGSLGHRITWAATGVAVPARELPGVQRMLLGAWNRIERLTGLPMPIPGPVSVSKLIKAVNAADVVIVHDGIYATSLIALAAARRRGVPSLLVQHIGEIPYRNPLLRALMAMANRWAVRPALARADQVLFISETVRRFFSDVLYRKAPLLIFNGVDKWLFRAPTESERRVARAEFSLPHDCPVAIFVGRFVEKKGLRHLHEAARLSPKTRFLLVGHGPIDPSSWSLPNVQVLGGLSPSQVARAYHASDVLVLPSIGEGFPLVVQEALASGLAVICGDETADADPEIAGIVTGVEIDADPARTGAKIARHLADMVWSGEAAATRARFAHDRYSWTSVAESYDCVLAGLFQHALTDHDGGSKRKVMAPASDEGMSETTISVAMTTYNGARFLKEQLDSIFAQTRLPDELVVCDDLSTDGTIEILREYAARSPFVMTVVLNDDRLGAIKNFDRAISLCSGDLICLCDQDDLWRPDKLSVIEQAFAAQPDYGAVLTNADLIDGSGRSLSGDLWTRSQFTTERQRVLRTSGRYDLLLGLPFATGATMAFRSKYKELVSPIPELPTFFHDRWLAVLIAAVGEIGIIPEKLIAYRLHPQQSLGVGGPLLLKPFIPYRCKSDVVALSAFEARLAERPHFTARSEFRPALQKRRQHIAERASYSSNPFRRVRQVASELRSGRYTIYPFGLIVSIQDILVGTR